MRESIGDPGQRIEHGPDLVDQFLLAPHAPRVLGLEHEKGVRLVQTHRIETDLVGTDARHDAGDFRDMLQDGFLDALVHPNRLVQRNRRQFLHLHDDVTLVHGRHEGLADLEVGQCCRSQQQRCAGNDHARVREAPDEHGFVQLMEFAGQPRFAVHYPSHHE